MLYSCFKANERVNKGYFHHFLDLKKKKKNLKPTGVYCFSLCQYLQRHDLFPKLITVSVSQLTPGAFCGKNRGVRQGLPKNKGL